MMIPVRYTDFDSSQEQDNGQGEGIIEKYIKPWINQVDMIITVSQSEPDDYHIDVFATATRSGFNDNMDFTRKDESKSINNTAPETIVTTLPDSFTQNSSKAIFFGKYFKTSVEYEQYNYNTKNSPNNSTKKSFPTQKTYYGPGGNYLSNEIFYRVAKLRKELNPNLATGHFHISKIQDAQMKKDLNFNEIKEVVEIVKESLKEGVK